MSDILLRHQSGAYKFLPGYPDHNDVLYALFINAKPVNIGQIEKLMGVDEPKLKEPLSVLLDENVITKTGDSFTVNDKETIKYTRLNGIKQ